MNSKLDYFKKIIDKTYDAAEYLLVSSYLIRITHIGEKFGEETIQDIAMAHWQLMKNNKQYNKIYQKLEELNKFIEKDLSEAISKSPNIEKLLKEHSRIKNPISQSLQTSDPKQRFLIGLCPFEIPIKELQH